MCPVLRMETIVFLEDPKVPVSGFGVSGAVLKMEAAILCRVYRDQGRGAQSRKH